MSPSATKTLHTQILSTSLWILCLVATARCFLIPAEAWSTAKLPCARRVRTVSPLGVGRLAESSPEDTTWRRQQQPFDVLSETMPSLQEQSDKNMLQRLVDSYSDLLEKKPLLTKSISASVIDGVGDLLAQWLEFNGSDAGFSIQWLRVVCFLWVGLLFEGPFTHYWFEFLNKIGDWMDQQHQESRRESARVLGAILPKQRGTTTLEQQQEEADHLQEEHPHKTMVQLTIDQTLGVLLLYPTYLLVYCAIQSVVYAQAWTDPPWGSLGEILTTQYQVWPALDYILLKWVAPPYQAGLTSVFNVGWNALSFCTLMATTTATP